MVVKKKKTAPKKGKEEYLPPWLTKDKNGKVVAKSKAKGKKK